MKKSEAWAKLLKLAASEKATDPALTDAAAVAKALERPSGADAYQAYLQATPDDSEPVAKSAPSAPGSDSVVWKRIESLAAAKAGLSLGHLPVGEQASAIAKALETPEGKASYARYRAQTIRSV